MPPLRVPAANGLWRRAQLLVSAYLTGLAEAALDDSVGYAKVREQFQQPIGAFQAVKHRCADMLTRASVAWNSTIFAALTDKAEGPDRSEEHTSELQSLMRSSTAVCCLKRKNIHNKIIVTH